ncbi:MAG TPA: trypsin-like peptidase domain-containing protein [Candidatus Methylacidiphilales bacterium]|jgi:S1-C subfamily serine protease|nr:trypsin-like peptidase domain-containing protein [Candidatus Methylacidiphilales bacterium]
MKIRLFPFALLILLAFAAGRPARAQEAPPANHAPASPPPTPVLTAPQGKLPPPPGKIDIANEPIVKIVANVQPAVVNITAQETVPAYFTNQFFRLYRGNRTAQSIGSGLIISADGFVLTNAHVVAMAEKEKEVSITLSSGSKYQAEIMTADDDADLALLKIEDKTVQFPYFDLTYTSPNLLGETVVALGSPADLQNSVSHGILSALHRSFTVEDHTYNNLIQTDAAINPGNSGGPLVDLNGGLVGINSAKLSGTAIENIGFAIPNDVVIPWANDAMAVARGLKPAPPSPVAGKLEMIRKCLGLTVKTLTPDEAALLNLPGGLLITHVDEDSPAGDAGVVEKMIIVKIGNRLITDSKSLPRELLQMQNGTNVRLQVVSIETVGPLRVQRGGSVMLTAR